MAEFGEVAEDLRLAAAAAAVAGDPFEVACGATIAQFPEAQFTAMIGELVGLGIVRPGTRSGSFSFCHPLLRQLAYSSTRPGWLLGAHRRAEHYLKAARRPIAERADHLELMARRGDQPAARQLTIAAEQAMKHDPAVAARWLRTALSVLAGAGEHQELRYELGYALGRSGAGDESWEIISELLARVDDQELRRKAVLFAAMLERHLGHDANAQEMLQAELAAALSETATPSSVHAAMWLELCYQSQLRANPDGQAERAEQALAVADVVGDAMRQAAALGQLALAAYLREDIPRAKRNAARARVLIDGVPDAVIRRELDACCYLAWSEVCLQSFPDALRHLDRLLGLARSGERGHALAQVLTLRSIVLRRLGDLTGAMEGVDEALTVVERTRSTRWRMTALAVRTDVALTCGQWELAIAAGEQAMAIAGTDVDRAIIQHVPASIAVARFVTGAPEGWKAAVTGAFGGPELPALERGLRPQVYETLTWMTAISGHDEQALAWALMAQAASSGLRLPYSDGFAHLALAQAHLICRPEVASAEAQSAIRRFRTARARFECGRATYVAALAAHALGRTEETLRLMARSYLLIADCGGTPLLRAMAGRLGLPAADDLAAAADPARDRCDQIELSARQSQIADLVARGLTNRQIARSLEMSEKTVETHLARIFAKLGVTNRAMLASSATRRRAGAG